MSHFQHARRFQHGVRLMVECLEDRTTPAALSSTLAALASQTDATVIVGQTITRDLMGISSILNNLGSGTDQALAQQTGTLATQSEAILTRLRLLETQLNDAATLANQQENAPGGSGASALPQMILTVETQSSSLITQLESLQTQLTTLNGQLAANGQTSFATRVSTDASQAGGMLTQAQSIDSQLVTIESDVGVSNGSPSASGGTAGGFNLAQSQAVVNQLYSDLLGRAPDPNALAAASGALVGGTSATTLVNAILGSTEFLGREVQTAYTQILNRGADPAGLNAAVGFLQAGGTLEQLEASLAGSDEFFAQAGNTNSGFITLLYKRVLNRSPEQLGLTGWLQGLESGGTRFDQALGILTSQEANQDVVSSFYTTYLGRIADPAGLAAWNVEFLGNPSELGILQKFFTVGGNEFVNEALSNAGLPPVAV